MVSLYHYYQIQTTGPKWKTNSLCFDDWIEILPELWADARVSYKFPLILYTNQIQMLKNNKGEIDVDFIGRMENYESDWKFISEKLDIKEEKKLVHYNATEREKDYRIYYKKTETIEIVRNWHEEDIRYFNYEF